MHFIHTTINIPLIWQLLIDTMKNSKLKNMQLATPLNRQN